MGIEGISEGTSGVRCIRLFSGDPRLTSGRVTPTGLPCRGPGCADFKK
jgi:hypothetical protein